MIEQISIAQKERIVVQEFTEKKTRRSKEDNNKKMVRLFSQPDRDHPDYEKAC